MYFLRSINSKVPRVDFYKHNIAIRPDLSTLPYENKVIPLKPYGLICNNYD